MALLRTSIRANFSKKREWEDSREISDFFSYFAQLNSIVSCFRKYNTIQKFWSALVIFQIEEGSKIAILATNRCGKWRKIMHFLFACKDGRDNIYQCTLDIL